MDLTQLCVCVCVATHTHIYLIPSQSHCWVPSGGETDETDGGPRMERHVVRGGLQPYLLRRVCCQGKIQKYDFGPLFPSFIHSNLYLLTRLTLKVFCFCFF